MSYQGYFIYKGIVYGEGTTVLFTDKIHQKYHFSSKLKNIPHKFIGGATEGVTNGVFTRGYMNFKWKEGDDWKYDKHSEVTVYNVDEDIAEIVEPVYVEIVPWQQQALDNIINKKVHPDIFSGVLIYILVMLIGCIFHARLIIWVVATIVFVTWLLNQYRT